MTRILPLLLGVVAALLTSNALAQSGAGKPVPLKGTVVDAAGAPVVGATVGLYSSDAVGFAPEELELDDQVVTDAGGGFE